jgi:hypothetical protein
MSAYVTPQILPVFPWTPNGYYFFPPTQLEYSSLSNWCNSFLRMRFLETKPQRILCFQAYPSPEIGDTVMNTCLDRKIGRRENNLSIFHHIIPPYKIVDFFCFLFLIYFNFFSFIHMCIQCLGHFSPFPPPPPPPPDPRCYQAETILPLSLLLLKREYKQ